MPVRGVVPIAQMTGEDEKDDTLLRQMAFSAQRFLSSFSWCKRIRQAYFGDGYGGVAAVFLFRIEPARPGVDEWLWVVMCNVSPAYLVTDSCKTPSEALSGYIEEVSKWVELAKQGRSSREIIPVNLAATPKNAESVESRLKVLKEVIVPAFRASESGPG
jgi:hypothetical protein